MFCDIFRCGSHFFWMDRLVTTFKQEHNIQRVVFQEKQMGFPTGLTLKKIDALEDFSSKNMKVLPSLNMNMEPKQHPIEKNN